MLQYFVKILSGRKLSDLLRLVKLLGLKKRGSLMKNIIKSYFAQYPLVRMCFYLEV